MKAPNCCPMCGKIDSWKLIDTSKKGFNTKHAVIGGILLGGVGLVAGFSGKRISTYQCSNCRFSHEYDSSTADKGKYAQGFLGYKKTGLNSVYIDLLRKVTPDCVFCGNPQDLSVKQDGSAYRFLCSNCRSEFRCEFTFSGQIKGKTVQILNCGEVNKDNLSVGTCDPKLLILDETKLSRTVMKMTVIL